MISLAIDKVEAGSFPLRTGIPAANKTQVVQAAGNEFVRSETKAVSSETTDVPPPELGFDRGTDDEENVISIAGQIERRVRRLQVWRRNQRQAPKEMQPVRG